MASEALSPLESCLIEAHGTARIIILRELGTTGRGRLIRTNRRIRAVCSPLHLGGDPDMHLQNYLHIHVDLIAKIWMMPPCYVVPSDMRKLLRSGILFPELQTLLGKPFLTKSAPYSPNLKIYNRAGLNLLNGSSCGRRVSKISVINGKSVGWRLYKPRPPGFDGSWLSWNVKHAPSFPETHGVGALHLKFFWYCTGLDVTRLPC